MKLAELRLACALFPTAILTTSPALATRATVEDSSPQPTNLCSIGTACVGNSLNGFSHSTPLSGLFSTMYVYKQGVVTFDGQLDQASDLGSTTFFAPGYDPSANYTASITLTNNTPQNDWGFVVSFYDGTSSPLFQALFAPYDYFPNYSQVFLLYSENTSRNPSEGSLIGFNFAPTGIGDIRTFYSDGIDLGASTFNVGLNFDGNDVSAESKFSVVAPPAPPPPPPAVPEPSTWVMMLAGFGAMGALFRRRVGGLHPA